MSSSESDVASASVDVKGDRNPVRHRVLKTMCLYVSFGTMVRQLEIVTKLTFWQYLPDLLPTTWWHYVVTTYGHIGVESGRRRDGGEGRMACRFLAWAEALLSLSYDHLMAKSVIHWRLQTDHSVQKFTIVSFLNWANNYYVIKIVVYNSEGKPVFWSLGKPTVCFQVLWHQITHLNPIWRDYTALPDHPVAYNHFSPFHALVHFRCLDSTELFCKFCCTSARHAFTWCHNKCQSGFGNNITYIILVYCC